MDLFPLWNSLRIAAISTVIVFFAGIFAAYYIARLPRLAKGLLDVVLTLPLAREYLFPIKFVVPSFLFTQLMSVFLRNDGDPALATKSVLFGGGVWRSLDAGSRTGSQWIRPHLHNAHRQHPEHRPRYHPPVRYFVPAALQHLLHLLLSGHDEALHRLCRVREPRRCHQRHSHLPASGDCRSERHLVRHAHHRAGSGGIYGGHDAALSEAADQVTAERIFRHIFPVP